MTMQRDTSSSWIYFLAIGLFYFVFLYLNANAISKETFIVDDDFYQHKYATAKELDEEKQITEILSNVLDSENTVLKNKNEASKREKIEPRNGIQQDTEAQITTKNAKIEEIFFLLLKAKEEETYSQQFFAKPPSERMTRLPDIMINGVKKCGSKTVQMFLHSHRKIFGSRTENFAGNFTDKNLNFEEKLGSWFERLDEKGRITNMINKNETKDSLFLTKADSATILQIGEQYDSWKKSNLYDPNHWIETDIQPSIPEWISKVKIITVLCDPVKRVFSDFLHVKAIHTADTVNAKFLGPNSKLYPFKLLNFNEFVEKYLDDTKFWDLQPDKIKKLVNKGFYQEYLWPFPDNYVIIDGGTLKYEPWDEMMRIESAIFNKVNVFVRKNFVQRPDGYYCIQILPSTPPDCMPDTKGRSTSTKEIINENSLKILTEIYRYSSLSYNLEKTYNRTFSWLDKYNKPS